VVELRPGAETRRFGRTASLLSVGVGFAGLLTYLFFSLASHNLSAHQYGEIVVLWSAVFVTISVAHRPVEQMLSRTIAERRARGEEIASALRVGVAIQTGVAVLLGVLALAFRDQLQDGLLSGDETLYWVLVFSIVTFGVSYYARGVLAGTRRFALLAALLVCESGARTAFALAVALGIANGQETVALGVAAAPAVSLAIVPIALAVLLRRTEPDADTGARPPVTVAAGGSFAAAVLVVMLSEQAFLNAGPLLVRAFEDAAAAGFIFNVLMVVRAPVLVFQGVATSLLPHLTRLRAAGTAGEVAFHDSIRATLIAVAAFAALVLVGVTAVGPAAMQIAFGDDFTYDRLGLMLMACAMGFYLASTTLSQAALAHGAAARAGRCWAISAALFLGWCLLPVIDDVARRVEVGFLGAAMLLTFLLARVYRDVPAEGISPDSPEEIEARLAAADEAG
jgi:O-antigen/teichoic acid export membrane protein